MPSVTPGDVARNTEESRARRFLGTFAPAAKDVARIYGHFLSELRVPEQTAAMLTLAVVLAVDPEEEL